MPAENRQGQDEIREKSQHSMNTGEVCQVLDPTETVESAERIILAHAQRNKNPNLGVGEVHVIYHQLPLDIPLVRGDELVQRDMFTIFDDQSRTAGIQTSLEQAMEQEAARERRRKVANEMLHDRHMAAMNINFGYKLENSGYALTPTEFSVLEKVSHGMRNGQIAEETGCSVSTIKNHVSSLIKKVGVNSRYELGVFALENGLVSLEDVADNFNIRGLHDLTSQELLIYQKLGKGQRNARIADELFISENGVKTHITNIIQKLDLKGESRLDIAVHYKLARDVYNLHVGQGNDGKYFVYQADEDNGKNTVDWSIIPGEFRRQEINTEELDLFRMGLLIMHQKKGVDASTAKKLIPSGREYEVLHLLMQGLSNTEIAWKLGVSTKTVKDRIAKLSSKFQVSSRYELPLACARYGYFESYPTEDTGMQEGDDYVSRTEI